MEDLEKGTLAGVEPALVPAPLSIKSPEVKSTEKPLPEPPRLSLSASDSNPDVTPPSPPPASFRPPATIEEDVPLPAQPVEKARESRPPPRPITKDYYSSPSVASSRPSMASSRPPTSSTKRFSLSSRASKRRIKYGTGKNARVELVPQPSDEPEDPLNWPSWKKNLNCLALLYMTAIVGVLKTIFVTVNGPLSVNYGVSYTAAVALTAVPLMLSAVTGMASLVVSRIYGKRPVYLASTALLWFGTVWSAGVGDSYGQNMAARVFQGLGWGAFETLVLGSFQDTFFEHELESRLLAHNVVSIATTWGAPLLGGVASAGDLGFVVQYQILNAFLAVGVLLMIAGAPETTFLQSEWGSASPLTVQNDAKWPVPTLTIGAAKAYMAKMRPWSYEANGDKLSLALQAPRAMAAPTTGLLFAVALLPQAALWSLVSSLSMLFSTMPFMLPTSSMGALLVAPFILSTIVAGGLSTSYFLKRFTPYTHISTLAVTAMVGTMGILGFGLYTAEHMHMPVGGGASPPTSTLWDPEAVGAGLSFPGVSIFLGFLAAAAVALDMTARPMIQRSTAFTSPNVLVGLRNMADMRGGLVCWRNFFVGAFVLGVPNAVWAWDGLRSTTLGMGITQIFATIAIGAVWFMWEHHVHRLDGRIMGLVDLSVLRKEASFFDTSE